MQVSHSHDHVTHAVIGGGTTIDFGISNSAEFFNILSSTLYKDQILAVVREVLCNAWDAHIEAGCTDKPVAVSIENDKLIVKDFGNGIHHDDIGLIYGTYGNSTKKNDGQQTGGFGLGCKAPFAYTEHFEVVSSHAGVRTIYAMAKSSAQVAGKPGITTIAQFPTDEHGLTVTIMLNRGDIARFSNLIKRIAYNGDMNLTFNGVLLDTINFDVSQNNWMVLSGGNPLTDQAEQILVRYGNVIYPVDTSHKELCNLGVWVDSFLGTFTYRYHYDAARLIFQAPPHSIAVTPSRESLSMQDHTVKTLVNLLEGFKKQMDDNLQKEKTEYLNSQIEQLAAKKDVSTLLSTDLKVPKADSSSSTANSFRLGTVKQVAIRQLQTHYPSSIEFRKADLSKRVLELSKAGLISRGLASTYLKDLMQAKKFSNYTDVSEATQWLHRNVLGKLATKLSAAKLNVDSMRVYDLHVGSVHGNVYQLTKYAPRNIMCCLPYLQSIVVLTNTIAEIGTRVQYLSNSPLKGQHLSAFIVFSLSRKKDIADAERAFWNKSGMTVLDMTKLEAPQEKPQPKQPAKPRLKGLPALSTMIDPTTHRVSTDNVYRHGETARVTEPLFILRNESKGVYRSNLSNFNSETTQVLIDLFGDKVGICNTRTQYENWKEKFPTDYAYLPKAVLDFCSKNQNIKEYLAHAKHNVVAFVDTHDEIESYAVVNILYKTPFMAKLVGFTDKRTKEERAYCLLLEYIYSNWGLDAALNKEIAAFWKCPINPKLEKLVLKAGKSTLIGGIDVSQMIRLMNDPKTKEKATKMFFFALNN